MSYHQKERIRDDPDHDSDNELFVKYGSEYSETSSKFVPTHEQIATDDAGNRRFHGAFTGGFSAGYYNTVGSAEGWAPSTFVSSRSNRAKVFDYTKPHSEKDPQSFHLPNGENIDTSFISSMFRIDCQFDFNAYSPSIKVIGSSGLGFQNETLASIGYNAIDTINSSSTPDSNPKKPKKVKTKSFKKQPNSTLSFLFDDELQDEFLPSSLDSNPKQSKKPKISSNTSTAKFSMRPSDDALKIIHSKSNPSDSFKSPEKTVSLIPETLIESSICLDGKPPTEGFVIINNLSKKRFKYSSKILVLDDQYLIPDSFVQMHQFSGEKNSKVNSNESILAFEIDNSVEADPLNQKTQEKENSILAKIASLTKNDAENALKGFIPFSSDPQKQDRYKEFLNLLVSQSFSFPSSDLSSDISELDSFYQAARVFKPLSSTMSKRFTTSSDANSYLDKNPSSTTGLLDVDSRQQAAKMDMYGALTRVVSDWIPSTLLCRRMNIANPSLGRKGNSTYQEKNTDQSFSLPNPSNTIALKNNTIAENPNSNTNASTFQPTDSHLSAETFAGSVAKKLDLDDVTAPKSLFDDIFGDSD
ncbi:G patch domain-containing protein 1-like protein [Smittium mucronatum]|uniref:G patch domain-containing protein 1-like protein n=1 Tax=Smittium mucronatum TaxID=133383 RepID=A0A1R0H0Y3_9FUNG|nr:G patch domain-containing protein 1-like protein [Smittium mucronatum]